MITRHIGSLLFVLAIPACAADASDAASAPSPEPTSSSSPPTPAEGPTVPQDLISWGFEPASPDCNGWPVVGADAIRAAPARSGAYSCKICSNGSAPDVGLMRDLGNAPAGRYVLTAWVRKRIQNAAPPEAIARIDATRADGTPLSAVASSVTVRDEWDRVEAILVLDQPVTDLRVTIGAPTPEAERCLFIDDVLLARE